MKISQIFIPLRVHSDYYLGKSSNKVDKIVEHCRKNCIPAAALTDHSNMFGALEFAMKCSKNGIQPISGLIVEVSYDGGSVGEGGGEKKDDRGGGGSANNGTVSGGSAPGPEIRGDFLLLAKNHQGYQNLLWLASFPHIQDATKVVSFSTFCEHLDGLIVLLGGDENSLFSKICLRRGEKEAAMLYHALRDTAAECYIEIQRGTTSPNANNRTAARLEDLLIDFAYQFHVPLVATNPVFFLERRGQGACDALLCISQGSYINVEEREKVNPAHYMKSGSEMAALFSDLPEAIANTVVIAQKCSYILEGSNPKLPRFVDDSEVCEDELLARLSKEGLNRRLLHITDSQTIDRYFVRLDYELSVIRKMGFSGYFLIVSDFIKWSKNQGIPVGPGRGSGAGSIIAWAVDITDIDPLAFGLLFERFLNPDRVSLPDFDIDFCQTRRDEVIDYVRQKYGAARVAHIITFGKLQARAVLRDVGRVLQMSYAFVDRICKMVPNNPAAPITLEEAIRIDKELQRLAESDPDVANLFSISLQLEGVNRHVSLHAAGVVISDEPIAATVPLYRAPESQATAVQFSMKYAEAAGLMKFDFLGLKTLTMLQDACSLASTHYRDRSQPKLDLHTFDDPATYELLSQGNTIGIFQFEGVGMREAIKKLRPTAINDLIALASLYRPGPMENIPHYINRKHGIEPVDYIHPKLEEALAETYGIIIYQEQVMQIVQIIAGFSLGEADIIRRAMGKKNKEEMEAQRSVFVSKAVEKGLVGERQASEIFDVVDKFAGYGFNKSHATAYAVIGYHTAYLKANYPHAFFVASINLDINDSDKIALLCGDIRSGGMVVVPPSINQSLSCFSIVSEVVSGSDDNSGGSTVEYKISFGLAGIKGIGVKIMEGVVAERRQNGQYRDLADFMQRCLPLGVNKRMLEQLAKAGALADLHPNAAAIVAGAESLLNHFNETRRREVGEGNKQQMSLFGGDILDSSPPPLPLVAPWNVFDKLQSEYEALGFYLTGHPLSQYDEILSKYGVISSNVIEGRVRQAGPDGIGLRVAGVVTAAKIRSGKGPRGGKYAFIQLYDQYGSIECSVFSEEMLTQNPYIVKEGSLVLATVTGKVDERGLRLIVEKVQLFQEILGVYRRRCEVIIRDQEGFMALRQICPAREVMIKKTGVTAATGAEEKAEGGELYETVIVVILGEEERVFFRSEQPWRLSNERLMAMRQCSPGIEVLVSYV